MAAAAVAAAACGPAEGTRARVERGGVAVVDVNVEIASSADERARGLRGHAPLGADDGLLIELPAALDDVCVVNDGVAFAIDAVFADAAGAVVEVAGDIPAGDPTPRCQDDVLHILEVAAGIAADARPGDRLVIDGR